MMPYFIDHNKKSIHQQKFAGDRCGFVGTSIEKREFTNCPNYVDLLVKEQNYKRCAHCESFQTALSS